LSGARAREAYRSRRRRFLAITVLIIYLPGRTSARRITLLFAVKRLLPKRRGLSALQGRHAQALITGLMAAEN